MTIITIKNILMVLGVIGFGYTVFSFALFAVGGMVMTHLYEDMNSGNLTKYKQDVTLTSPPTPDDVNASHIALPLMQLAPYAVFFMLFGMLFYIAMFTKFVKPKLNNPFKKSSWTKGESS